MMPELKVLILGVNRYNFTDSNSGKEVRGTTVHFVQLSEASEDDKVGFFPTKATLSYESFESFKGMKFPLQGVANWTLDMTNKKNPVKILGFNQLETSLVG